jgi:hypothetical protein
MKSHIIGQKPADDEEEEGDHSGGVRWRRIPCPLVL